MTARMIHDGLFRLNSDGSIVLLGSLCGECENRQFPAAETCSGCGSDDQKIIDLEDRGTIWLSTVVNNAPPGYIGAVPYGFGVVELAHGLRIITLIAPAQVIEYGTPVHLVAHPLGTDENDEAVITYAFSTEAS